MRTTVEIDDRVLERAKSLAARSGQTLGAVVNEALGVYLAARPAQSKEKPFELIVRGRAGAPFPSAADVAAAEEADEIARLGIPPRAAP